MYYVLDEFEVYLQQLSKGNLWNFNSKKRKRNFTCLSKVLFPRISSGSGGIDSIFDNNGCSSIWFKSFVCSNAIDVEGKGGKFSSIELFSSLTENSSSLGFSNSIVCGI